MCKYYDKKECEKGRCTHPDGPIFCDHSDAYPCEIKEDE